MIVVVNRIPVAEGHEKEFEERFRTRRRLVDQLPGFVRFEFLRPIEGDYYEVRTSWQDMKSFENWTRSEDFRLAHSDRPPEDMFSGQNMLEIYEILTVNHSAGLATSD